MPWNPCGTEDVTISVMVPVKNPGETFPELLTRMNAQKGFRRVEIVVVDSGSTDRGVQTAVALGAKVIRIAPDVFSHSHARNLGAEHASGEYLLFTVQDALPPSDQWLYEMFMALRRYDVVAVSCSEKPRSDSDLFYRAISWNHHRFLGVVTGDRVMAKPANQDPLSLRQNAQLSDTACLIGRDIFLKYRHRGGYAEDLDLGIRLISDGHRLAFLGSTHIIHSHNRPAYYYLKRAYVEQLALFEILPGYPAAPGRGTAVTHDILRSYAAVDALIRGCLQVQKLPCAPERLRIAVTAGLRSALTIQLDPPAASNGYLDERTRSFVKRLADHQAGPNYCPSCAAEGFLLEALGGVSGMICDYLDQTSRTVNRELVEEFKSALYKGWAVQCGAGLASAYWQGPETVKVALRLLHEELTSDI